MNFEERAGVEIFKFEKEGDFLAGVLMGMEQVQVNPNKPAVPAFHVAEIDEHFERLTGNEYQFLQTADLRSKIKSTDNGKVVLVKRSGTKKTNNGEMIVFDVKVSSSRFPGGPSRSAQANPEITDADIPF